MAFDHPPRRTGRVSGQWERISAVRGLATLLIVVSHVIGGDPDAGMRLPEDHGLRLIVAVLGYLPMPIFAVVAGNLYGLRPVHGGQAARFLRHRAWQFGLPFLVNSTLCFLLEAALHGRLDAAHLAGIWRIYLFPYAAFWYLWAMFLVMAAVCLLDLAGITRRPAGLFGIALLALGERFLPASTLVILSIDSAVYLLPYFLLGLAARRFPAIVATRGAMLCCGLLAGLGWAIHLGHVVVMPATAVLSRVGLLGPFIGGAGTLVLLRWMPASPALVGIGRSALTIYLFQIYFLVATRLTLQACGVTDAGVHFILGTAAGIVGPMLLEPLIGHFMPLRIALLGMRR